MSRPSPHSGPIRRRTFLIGAAATGLLSACGSDGDGVAPQDDADENTGAGVLPAQGEGDGSVAPEFAGDSADLDEGTFSIIQRYPSNVAGPGEIRLPFSLSNAEAQFVTDGPLSLGAQIVDLDGNEVGSRLTAVRRDVAPSPYYAFRAQVDTPGFYAIVVDGGPVEGANFQVMESSTLTIPSPGDTLAGFDTPTPGAPAGIDPICTREPNCDFHSVTLTGALADARPVAYFVGTPAFCQTGSCAPALEALIEVAPDYSDTMRIVHAEVFTDLTATTIAPAVEAVKMTFEPALFITDADGTIIERVDGLWDVSELRERFDAALA